jgi:hypothetical protein
VAIRRLIVLAATCVFAKQSLEPILCGLRPLSTAWIDQVPKAPLLPKLRGHFAEFLFHGSLEHLRLLASPTCVGLRYGHTVHSPTGLFSAASSTPLGQVRRPNTRRPVSPITLFSPGPGYSVASGRPAPDGCFASAAPRGSTHTARHGNLRPFPIAYASRPRLRGRLTRSG